jgi:hypothetical protein
MCNTFQLLSLHCATETNLRALAIEVTCPIVSDLMSTEGLGTGVISLFDLSCMPIGSVRVVSQYNISFKLIGSTVYRRLRAASDNGVGNS